MSRLFSLVWAAGLVACLAALSPLTSRAAEPGVQAPIGLKLLKLPLPAGFADAMRDLPQMRAIGERVTPPSNRLLALFMSQEDHQRAKGGQAPAMQRYFMVQTLRQAESASVSPAEFAEVRTMLRQQYKSLVQQAGNQVQGLLASATRFVVQSEGRSDEVPTSMAITTAVLKGKLLYFYAYAVYRDAQDLDWLRGVTRDWLTLASAGNPS